MSRDAVLTTLKRVGGPLFYTVAGIGLVVLVGMWLRDRGAITSAWEVLVLPLVAVMVIWEWGIAQSIGVALLILFVWGLAVKLAHHHTQAQQRIDSAVERIENRLERIENRLERIEDAGMTAGQQDEDDQEWGA